MNFSLHKFLKINFSVDKRKRKNKNLQKVEKNVRMN